MKTRDRIENLLALLETTGDVQYWTNAIANDSDEVSSNERDVVEENEFRLHQPGLKTPEQRFYGWKAVKKLIERELLKGALSIKDLYFLDYLESTNELQLAVADLFNEWEAQGIVQKLKIETPERKFKVRTPWLQQGTTSYKYKDYVVILGPKWLIYTTEFKRVAKYAVQ